MLAVGNMLDVPHPAITAPQTQHARTWIVPPSSSKLTDGAALYEAYAAARASLHLDAVR
ncbi:hypothetical protein [Streptomyces sp. NPDC048527]|uniref:hypothetical protein n=1 Tax=Streptomyces sp. NPDC048527 TaxID=3365568 RepID=UPI00371F0EB3